MSGERFMIDTSILIRSVDASAGLRHLLAVEIIERAVIVASCLTLQSVSEFFSACCRGRLVSPESAADMARAWLDMFPTVCATQAAARVALDHVLAGRASYWDALLVATAEEAGCSAILTENLGDGTTFGAMRIINPFGANGISEAADRLLRVSA